MSCTRRRCNGADHKGKRERPRQAASRLAPEDRGELLTDGRGQRRCPVHDRPARDHPSVPAGDLGHLAEPARLTTIPQRHPRRTGSGGFPRVARLHRKRALGRAHHELAAWLQFDDLVGVGDPPAGELRNERNPRARLPRRGCLPLDRLDVGVPLWRIARIPGGRGHLSARPGNDYLCQHIDCHTGHGNRDAACPGRAACSLPPERRGDGRGQLSPSGRSPRLARRGCGEPAAGAWASRSSGPRPHLACRSPGVAARVQEADAGARLPA